MWRGAGPCPHATIAPRQQVVRAMLSGVFRTSLSSGFLLNISIKTLKDSTPKKENLLTVMNSTVVVS